MKKAILSLTLLLACSLPAAANDNTEALSQRLHGMLDQALADLKLLSQRLGDDIREPEAVAAAARDLAEAYPPGVMAFGMARDGSLVPSQPRVSTGAIESAMRARGFWRLTHQVDQKKLWSFGSLPNEPADFALLQPVFNDDRKPRIIGFVGLVFQPAQLIIPALRNEPALAEDCLRIFEPNGSMVLEQGAWPEAFPPEAQEAGFAQLPENNEILTVSKLVLKLYDREFRLMHGVRSPNSHVAPQPWSSYSGSYTGAVTELRHADETTRQAGKLDAQVLIEGLAIDLRFPDGLTFEGTIADHTVFAWAREPDNPRQPDFLEATLIPEKNAIKGIAYGTGEGNQLVKRSFYLLRLEP